MVEQFVDAEHFYSLIRPSGAKFIDYYETISRLSKLIFEKDPFSSLVLNADIHEAFERTIALRNYIAHESPESKVKLVKHCFGSCMDKFMEPNAYLKARYSKSNHHTSYTMYVDNILLAAEIIAGKYPEMII